MTAPKCNHKITKTMSEGIKKTAPLSSLGTKLKSADQEIQNYIRALEAENLKLQRQIAKHHGLY